MAHYTSVCVRGERRWRTGHVAGYRPGANVQVGVTMGPPERTALDHVAVRGNHSGGQALERALILSLPRAPGPAMEAVRARMSSAPPLSRTGAWAETVKVPGSALAALRAAWGRDLSGAVRGQLWHADRGSAIPGTARYASQHGGPPTRVQRAEEPRLVNRSRLGSHRVG